MKKKLCILMAAVLLMSNSITILASQAEEDTSNTIMEETTSETDKETAPATIEETTEAAPETTTEETVETTTHTTEANADTSEETTSFEETTENLESTEETESEEETSSEDAEELAEDGYFSLSNTMIINGGLTVVHNGQIYYTNTSDNNTLYCQNNGADYQVLNQEVSYLNSYGDNIYAISGKSILKITTAGQYEVVYATGNKILKYLYVTTAGIYFWESGDIRFIGFDGTSWTDDDAEYIDSFIPLGSQQILYAKSFIIDENFEERPDYQTDLYIYNPSTGETTKIINAIGLYTAAGGNIYYTNSSNTELYTYAIESGQAYIVLSDNIKTVYFDKTLYYVNNDDSLRQAFMMRALTTNGSDDPYTVNLEEELKKSAEGLLAVAYSQLGYTSTISDQGNYSKYGEWYGYPYGEWCAMFISWCANQADISTSVIKKFANCDTGMNWYIANGTFSYSLYQNGSAYTPRRGDIIFFSAKATLNDSTHVGIVTGSDATRVYTIEGNTSNMVAERSYLLTDKYILGYATPVYVGESAQTKQLKAFVTRLYELVMERDPDSTGLSYWVDLLVAGDKTAAKVLTEFLESKEFTARGLSNTDYIKILYNVCMGRTYDAEGLAYWTDLLDNGVSRTYILKGFVGSAEFTAICKNYDVERGSITTTEPRDKSSSLTAYVNRSYKLLLNRAPDAEGINYWCTRLLEKKSTPRQVAEGFVASDEFKAMNLSDSEYVTILYRALMGREPEGEGFEYWMNYIKQGGTRVKILNNFLNSKEFANIVASFGL